MAETESEKYLREQQEALQRRNSVKQVDRVEHSGQGPCSECKGNGKKKGCNTCGVSK